MVLGWRRGFVVLLPAFVLVGCLDLCGLLFGVLHGFISLEYYIL
jgi:hypothetical protein